MAVKAREATSMITKTTLGQVSSTLHCQFVYYVPQSSSALIMDDLVLWPWVCDGRQRGNGAGCRWQKASGGLFQSFDSLRNHLG